MKPSRHKKVIGICLGERSLLAAEVLAGPRPQVRHLAEMSYPQDVSLDKPEELGKALQQFLRDGQFSAGVVVVGIPAKWIVVKSKDVPAANDAMLASILRLSVETDFPSDLKDMVYDFCGQKGDAASSRTVLLMGTQRKNVDAALNLCKAARLTPVAVTPSALALGQVSRHVGAKDLLVLSVGSTGSELSVQQGDDTGTIRHLRAAAPQPMFVSELRRVVSTFPSTTADREMVLWDTSGLNPQSLGEQLGLRVSGGELSSLGVDPSPAGANGESSMYAAAVALAMTGITGDRSIDFAHSRLAEPKSKHVTRRVIWAAVALVAIIGGGIYAYQYMQNKENDLQAVQNNLANLKDGPANALKFVNMMTFAQYWHAGDPIYLACLRDLTNAMPNDSVTYATSIDFQAVTPPVIPANTNSTTIIKGDPPSLSVTLKCKTSDPQHVQLFEDRLLHNSDVFTKIQVPENIADKKTGERQFTITFVYVPPKPVAQSLPANSAPKASH